MTVAPDAREPRLLVADSFRVRISDGVAQVRAFDLHLERFRANAIEAISAVPAVSSTSTWIDSELGPFLDEAPARIAAGGEGFPRLELWSDGGLEVAIRPLPALAFDIALATTRAPARPTPAVKGPNISLYATLNRMSGAESLLVDERGRVIEGATTSLVWWRGSTLCTVRETSRVASITEVLIVEAAHRAGFAIASEDITADELRTHEVWAVNALHGIRAVTGIDGNPLPPPDAARLELFRAALDGSWPSVSAIRPR